MSLGNTSMMHIVMYAAEMDGTSGTAEMDAETVAMWQGRRSERSERLSSDLQSNWKLVPLSVLFIRHCSCCGYHMILGSLTCPNGPPEVPRCFVS